jgi:uncharacterized protein YukJ
MPLARYGVLRGKAIEVRLGASQSPHYQVRLVDDTVDYRIAINVMSQVAPSEVEYLVVERFEHPITAIIEALPLGFTALASSPTSGALDFIRGNLFDRRDMVPLPFNVPGPDNDLNEKIDRVMQRAIADEHAVVSAFGQRWGPEEQRKDKYFGFLPGNGIHDIHMNQGNVPRFVADDGIWQDGGLLIHFPHERQWTAVFLRFQSQSWNTDDKGHRIGAAPPIPPPTPPTPPPIPPLPTTDDPLGLVRIVAALVNPTTSPEVERVTLLNRAPHEVDLTGWALLDTNRVPVPLSGTLAAGDTRVVTIERPAALSNKGGSVSLVDEDGRKVDGVAYTKEQAQHAGWTVVF